MDQNRKPTRLNKDGTPAADRPAKKKSSAKNGKHAPAKGGRKGVSAKPAKPKQPERPKGPQYPGEWIYLHREEQTVRQLKEYFLRFPELDVEVWPELEVLELTFPSGVFVDFERARPEELPEDDWFRALVEREKPQTRYFLSVEPYCGEAEMDFLRRLKEDTGAVLAADSEEERVL